MLQPKARPGERRPRPVDTLGANTYGSESMRAESEGRGAPEDRGALEEEKRPLERELTELRKEVIESRNLIIKTDNLLKNLFAELKLVTKKGDEQYRRTWFASATAYLVLFALSVIVAFLGAKASVSSQRAKTEAAMVEAEQAKKRADDSIASSQKSKQDSDAAKVASDRALVVYKFLTEGANESRMKGLDELAKLDRSRLNQLEQRVLDDRARSLKTEVAQGAFERGRFAYRKGDMKTAAVELKRYLTLDPEGADSAQALFFAGSAAYELKDWEGAVSALERFIGRAKGQKNADYGFMLLGQSHEQLGHFDRAIDVYKRGIAEYSGEFSSGLQQRLKAIQKSGNGAATANGPATPAADQAGGTAGR